MRSASGFATTTQGSQKLFLDTLNFPESDDSDSDFDPDEYESSSEEEEEFIDSGEETEEDFFFKVSPT